MLELDAAEADAEMVDDVAELFAPPPPAPPLSPELSACAQTASAEKRVVRRSVDWTRMVSID